MGHVLSILIRKSTVKRSWVISFDFGHPINIPASTMFHSLLAKASNGPLGQMTYQLHHERGDALVFAENQDAPSTDVEAFARWIAFSFGLEAEIIKLPMANLTAQVKFIYPESNSPSLIVRLPNTMSYNVYNIVASAFFDGLRLFSVVMPGRTKAWKIILSYADLPFAGSIDASRAVLNLLLEFFTAETGIKILYSEYEPSNEDFNDLTRAIPFPGL